MVGVPGQSVDTSLKLCAFTFGWMAWPGFPRESLKPATMTSTLHMTTNDGQVTSAKLSCQSNTLTHSVWSHFIKSSMTSGSLLVTLHSGLYWCIGCRPEACCSDLNADWAIGIACWVHEVVAWLLTCTSCSMNRVSVRGTHSIYVQGCPSFCNTGTKHYTILVANRQNR